ncbi:AAA family ATPase [Solimonas sp. SE-A11]|uniref:ATP-binding protein n=1 Tax=Solimonas sp. SE-A11 TaxID=3054954 RepID=UPI00259CBF99|nr:AAA family ATPase [Solimonas sp. SE-A11]MDM4772615.1 AAA family ATPase [Solimonas sp. SE-A11]
MSETSAIRFGPFCLMGRHGPLLRENREIKLQRKALAVLWTLACHPGEAVTRSALMDAVWSGAIVVDDVLSYQIKALRQAIEDDPRNPQYILTAHRIGFRLVVPSATPPSPQDSALVGREAELQFLRDLHERARQGQRQVAFICGEAGIGKTALVDDFLQRLRHDAPNTVLWFGRCLETTGESEPYQPVYDALDGGARGAQGEELLDQLRRSAPSWLRQLAQFLPPGEIEQLRRITAGAPPEGLRRELVEALEAYTASRPLVMVIEDLHWSDASTVALLGLLAQRESPARLLVICSCRPIETILTQHPARALQLNLATRGRAQTLHLAPLQPDDVRLLIHRRLAESSPEQSEEILRRSGGHPLFLIHLTDYLREGIPAPAGTSGLEGVVPPRLRELIELQLSQLTASEQLLLEIGAVSGQEFAAAAAAAGSGIPVEAVEEALEALVRRQLFIAERGLAIWPDGTVSGRFQFRHTLYGQALRQRLSGSRLARLHRRLAERLETAYSGRGAEIATDLAHHYEAGGAAAKAAEWCVQTAQTALDRLATHEVREQVARGLALLAPLAPDAARHAIELGLRIVASRSLQIEHGFGADAAFEHRDRIDALIDLVGDHPLLIPAVQVQWVSRHFSLDLERAVALGERLRDIGRAVRNVGLECGGLGWASHSLHNMGLHERADQYASEGLRLIHATTETTKIAPEGQIAVLGIHALTRWFLGYPEQALALADQACAASERLGNPYTHCVAVCASRGLVLDFTGDYRGLLILAEEMLELAQRYGQTEGRRWASILLGVAQFRNGDPAAGVRTLQPMLEEMRRLGLVISAPIGLINLAQAWAALGDLPRAMEAAEQALQLIRRRGHRPLEPEALRTIGELQRRARPRSLAAATVPIWEALELARSRKALSLELRAATSLARLLRDQGRSEEARAQLEPVLARFSEGHALSDQVEARALIASIWD